MKLPYLTAELPGIGGRLKAEPADFFVEEVPLYQPSGQGQHVYVEIEKQSLSTYAAIRAIARALRVPTNSVGYAGLKDARAITRQTLSIYNVDQAAVEALDLSNIKVLQVNRHTNKIKIGHLAGNRFKIKVRQVAEDDLPAVEKILVKLAEKGVPNFFGQQRFGNRGNTHRLGEMLIRQNAPEFVAEYLGRPQPHEVAEIQAARQLVDESRWSEALEKWPGNLPDERDVVTAIVKAEGRLEAAFRALDRKLKSFFISAFQSSLFNELLTQRLDTLERLEKGDVAYIHGKGASFVVEDAALEQPRADAFEISPSGPLFGPKMLQAKEEPGRREEALLGARNLRLEDFKIPGLKMRGARRPYRFSLKQAKVWWDDGLLVSFELQPGAYATTVMAEIMKND